MDLLFFGKVEEPVILARALIQWSERVSLFSLKAQNYRSVEPHILEVRLKWSICVAKDLYREARTKRRDTRTPPHTHPHRCPVVAEPPTSRNTNH